MMFFQTRAACLPGVWQLAGHEARLRTRDRHGRNIPGAPFFRVDSLGLCGNEIFMGAIYLVRRS